MNCPLLKGIYVLCCGAGNEVYVPSRFEIEEYCWGNRYKICPFYRVEHRWENAYKADGLGIKIDEKQVL
ncbi:MAG: hypothetical protein AB1632_10480 [Nitrospirota bacterium]